MVKRGSEEETLTSVLEEKTEVEFKTISYLCALGIIMNCNTLRK